MRTDAVFGVSGIDSGFEHDNGLSSVLCPPKPADELFGLAAEHAACDDFDPADVARGEVGLHGGSANAEMRGLRAHDCLMAYTSGRKPYVAVCGRRRNP